MLQHAHFCGDVPKLQKALQIPKEYPTTPEDPVFKCMRILGIFDIQMTAET